MTRTIQQLFDLKGKTALVTGGSRGLGLQMAHALGEAGARIMLSSRKAEDLEQAAAELQAAGIDARWVAADCAREEDIHRLASETLQRMGDVDILINNAGRSIRRPLAESLDRWHDVERTMALNYYSPLRLIRGLAPGMIERGDGHIINVATWGVLSEASPLFSVYNASKAALSTVSRTIETEWARNGVHSTTLYYPLVATPMIAPTKEYQGMPALSSAEAAQWMIDAARHRPVRIAPRFGISARAVDVVAPGLLNGILKRQRMQPN